MGANPYCLKATALFARRCLSDGVSCATLSEQPRIYLGGCLRRRNVAKDKLRAFGRRRFQADLVNLLDRFVGLGIWIVTHVGKHKPDIKRRFAAFRCNFSMLPRRGVRGRIA